MKSIWALIFFNCASVSHADVNSAASILLNTVQPQQEIQTELRQVDTDIQLSDIFLTRLFSLYREQKNLSYDVNVWIQMVLRNEFTSAAHLWSAIERKIPESFRLNAQAVYLYLLWKLKLPQTFFSSWTSMLSLPRFKDALLTSALHDVIRTDFDRWLDKEAIVGFAEQETVLQKLDKADPIFVTVLAWFALRNPQKAHRYLELLPPSNIFMKDLAETVALDFAKKGDLAKAASILKKYVEPIFERQADTKALAKHYLKIARLLYQAGALDAAENHYEKIPTGVPDFLEAREELIWVWLRKGNVQRLRGELKTLKSSIFERRFAPEVFVVRAVSNLKLCFYDEVEKDLKNFQQAYLPWAKKIDEMLQKQDPELPESIDQFTQYYLASVQKRIAEEQKLAQLSTESIQAVLPAVGPQSHWMRARNLVHSSLEEAKKLRAQEVRRQWKNYRWALNEAIRKMQFVKVEFLSQLHFLAKEESAQRFSSKGAGVKRNAYPQEPITTVSSLKKSSDSQVYPFDGVFWPDELFKLRSLAQNRCLNRGVQ